MQLHTPQFTFKEVDTEGKETLEAISIADNFNRWMYDTIKPFCKGQILEIGSGTGNISKFFLENDSEIMLSDVRENYCDILSARFSKRKNVLGIKNVDLAHSGFNTHYEELLEKFDTVFALNVVEHIENDTEALANAKKLLKTGGTLIILVPAYQCLYNQFDRNLYHYRRYTKKSLSELFVKNSYAISNKFYFNALGILGWFISGKIWNNEIIPASQMSFYNAIVPFAKLLDAALLKRVGLSVILVGKK
jgi:SAM-dependent methyltransferase